MNYRKLTVLIISAFMNMNAIFGQNTGNGHVSGIVFDYSSERPFELVNVALMKTSDSAIVAGCATNSEGKYDIHSIPDGSYFLRFSIIGYTEFIKAGVVINPGKRSYKMPDVFLTGSPITLSEALVTSKKNVQNNSIDRKVYNVGQDIMSKSGSASELLQNIPSVQVDIDGSISLRGSSAVMIMIDGKASQLLANNAPAVLEQMPANSIDRIEVITNPSAKFKPDGTGGIINIVMKKNAGTGLTGNVTVNAGNHERYNGNAGLTYSFDGLTMFGTYGYRHDDRNRYLNENSDEYSNGNLLSNYIGSSHSHSSPVSRLGSMGLDYKFSKDDKFGLSGSFMNQDLTWMDDASKLYSDGAGVSTLDYNRNRREAELRKQSDASAYYTHDLPGEDNQLKVELKYSDSREDEDNYYTNVYRTPRQPNYYEDTKMREDDNQLQVSSEYSHQLSEHSRLETGYEGEFNKLDVDLKARYLDQNTMTYTRDAGRTNHFIVHEKVNAAYAVYENTGGAIGYKLGLRLEHSEVSSDLVNMNTVIDNSYFGLYPTLHLAYKINNGEIQMNYSRRVRRPEADDMNPFPEYQDPRNIRKGNPKLRPEYTHSFELGFRTDAGNFSFVQSLFYRYTYDRFTTVSSIENDTVIVSSYENLDKDESVGLELVCTGSVQKIMSANISLTGFYNRIDASKVGYSADKSTLSWSGSANFNFNVSENTFLQINSNFRAARLTPQGKTRPSYVVNAGIKHEMFGEKLALTLAVSDIFKSQKRETETDAAFLKQTVINKRDSGVIYLGLTYYFGGTERKSKEKNLQYDNGF